MNVRSHVVDLTVESQHVREVVATIFHTVILHRCFGKISYKKESTYSIGSLGVKDVDCSHIDFTYCAVNCPELSEEVNQQIAEFHSELRSATNSGATRTGTISLEFYEKKKQRWPFNADLIPWEIWTVKLTLVSAQSVPEQHRREEMIGTELAEKVFYITQCINRSDYVPKTPDSASEMPNIYHTKYADIHPFLFRIKHTLSDVTDPNTVSTSVKKLLNYS